MHVYYLLLPVHILAYDCMFMVLITDLSCEHIMFYIDYCTLFPVICSHWVYFIYSLPPLTCFQVAGSLSYVHDMRCFRLYSLLQVVMIRVSSVCTGGTLARREKKGLSYVALW